MVKNIRLATAAAIAMLVATPASAQHTPEEIRKLLGHPVDMEAAAVLGASRASHRDLCGGPTEYEGHAAGVSRLQYGALDPADKERFTAAMSRQHESNAAIYETLSEDAKAAFCSGLARTVLAKTADFVEAHPQLFEEKEVAERDEPEPRNFIDVATEKLDGMEAWERMYVARVAENHVMDDARQIVADPENEKDGYVWAMKVLATDFAFLSMLAEIDHPDVAAAYRERSDIYAGYVRGEVSGEELQAREAANERRKNEVYDRLLQAYSRTVESPSKTRIAELETVAKDLAGMVSGHAKFIASE